MTEMQIRRIQAVINNALYRYQVKMQEAQKKVEPIFSQFDMGKPSAASAASYFFVWETEPLVEVAVAAQKALELQATLDEDPEWVFDWAFSQLREETGVNRSGTHAIAAQAKIKFMVTILEIRTQAES